MDWLHRNLKAKSRLVCCHKPGQMSCLASCWVYAQCWGSTWRINQLTSSTACLSPARWFSTPLQICLIVHDTLTCTLCYSLPSFSAQTLVFDAHSGMLTLPYCRPYHIISRHPKNFKILINGHPALSSIDHLKSAFLPDSGSMDFQSPSHNMQKCPSQPSISSSWGRIVHNIACPLPKEHGNESSVTQGDTIVSRHFFWPLSWWIYPEAFAWKPVLSLNFSCRKWVVTHDTNSCDPNIANSLKSLATQ